MIVDTITNASQFRDQFHAMGRGTQFSYEGLGLLFDYLDQVSDDIGEPLELDVIAICCDYAEATLEDIAKDYSIDLEDDGNELNNVLDYLADHSTICGVTEQGTIVYSQF